MRIKNCVVELPKNNTLPLLEYVGAALLVKLGENAYPLRCGIVFADDDKLVIECTVVDFDLNSQYSDTLAFNEIESPQRKNHQSSRFAVVQVVPTGIRCEFGGHAGDAAPVTNLLGTVADKVITHPNAVNASDINEMSDKVLYVEGKSLDDFMLGHVGLQEGRTQKIGTFVDPTGRDQLDDVINVLNAARTAAGIDCSLCEFAETPLGVTINWCESGSASGSVQNLDALVDTVEQLIQAGATAIGGVSVIEGVDEASFEDYLGGRVPNPSGVVEAIITHLISKIFRVPTAHAPLPYYTDRKVTTQSPRAAAEFISRPHYFCVLKGLSRAPQLLTGVNLAQTNSETWTLNDVGAVVAPASALGGIPMLAADLSGIPIIAVKENKTILNVTADLLGLRNVVWVESYLEAVGVVSAFKSGISLESVRRPVKPIDVAADTTQQDNKSRVA